MFQMQLECYLVLFSLHLHSLLSADEIIATRFKNKQIWRLFFTLASKLLFSSVCFDIATPKYRPKMGSHREHQTHKLFISSQSFVVPTFLFLFLFDWNHWSRTQVHLFSILPILSFAIPDCLWPIFKAGSRDSFATKMSRKRHKKVCLEHI